MRWVNFSAIPELEIGQTRLSPKWQILFSRKAYSWSNAISPGDGLMETTATILPPGTGIDEYIINIYGSHYIYSGNYNKDVKVIVPNPSDERKSSPDGKIISAIIRAFPVDLIEN